MKVLIVALLALAVSADNYGHNKYHAYSPYYSYGDHGYTYPYSYGNNYGLNYGSSLYGTPYYHYGYGHDAYKTGYGVGGVGHTYYTGADQVAAVKSKVYQPARIATEYIRGGETFHRGNEHRFSSARSPGRISFTKDFSALPRTQFIAPRSGINPAVGGSDGYKVPATSTIPQHSRKTPSVPETSQKAEVHDFIASREPGRISFGQDFPSVSTGSRGFGVKSEVSRDDVFSRTRVTEVAGKNERDGEAFDRNNEDKYPTSGGASRISFTQDHSRKTSSSKHEESDTRSDIRGFDDDVANDFLDVHDENSDDTKDSTGRDVQEPSTSNESDRDSFPTDFSGVPHRDDQHSSEDESRDSSLDRDVDHDFDGVSEHSEENSDENLKNEHRGFSTTSDSGKTSFTQDFPGLSKPSNQHRTGTKTVVPSFDDDVTHGVSEHSRQQHTEGSRKTGHTFTTTRRPGKIPVTRDFSGLSGATGVRATNSRFDTFANPSIPNVKPSITFTAPKPQAVYPVFPARSGIAPPKSIASRNVAPVILSPVEERVVIPFDGVTLFEDSVSKHPSIVAIPQPEVINPTLLVPVPESYVNDRASVFGQTNKDFGAGSRIGEQGSKFSSAAVSDVVPVLPGQAQSWPWESYVTEEQPGYSYFGDSPVFSSVNRNNLLYSYSSPFVLSPYSYTPVKGFQSDKYVQQKETK